MIHAFALFLLGLSVGTLIWYAGFKAGKTEMLREELEYGEKLRAQIEAGIKPEERDLFDWERFE